MDSQSLAFIESLYADFLRDPTRVPEAWRGFFETWRREAGGNGPTCAGPSFRQSSIFNPPGHGPVRTPASGEVALRQDRLDQLVRAYRVRGHRIARLDPLGLPAPVLPQLELEYYGFSEKDLDRSFSSHTIAGADRRTLREILELLQNTYCRSIGVQFMHIDDLHIRHWLQDQMEGTQNRIKLSRERQLRILTRLTDAVIFEQFIQSEFVGAKRFSLEGAESLIPLLHLAIEKSCEQGVDELVIGMAHRGRLNVLVNILGKSPRDVFREFEDKDPEKHVGRGDVKYHLGFHSDWTSACERNVHLALCFNPSHLEFTNPVAMGRVRAKQDRLGDAKRRKYMLLLIHGDAAFAGEGIVQETLNLSALRGYRIGGTIHVIVNNQIGFTTCPADARSSTYACDVGKMLQSPIFHVNGEDPEAVAQVINLAMEFRFRFKRDVIIDMYCYRRHGHNEGDEPSFTQPQMYRAIEERPAVHVSYLDHLVTLGEVTREEGEEIARSRRKTLENELSAAHETREEKRPYRPSILGRVWRRYKGGLEASVPDVDTGVERGMLETLLDRLARVPSEFHLHPKMEKLFEQRREMARGERPLDWSAGEALAFATLAVEGHRVRLSGQDSERGTFSHRHAVLHDYENGQMYMPLRNLTRDQAPVEIYNSPLSEAAVLGFEYGYSIAYPDALVAWEAQFGDFANAAQVIVDQFIVSAEDKWGSLSGLVLLLPHGFEGMGPEHSSARLERFLLLSAEDNIQVVNPTTPAQFFHVLRRQVLRPWRKPLVVMTPKSLLRHPQAVSSLEELAEGRFRRALPDARGIAGAVRRVLLCSGKIYYALEARRQELGCDDVALLRLEQLYPLYDETVREALASYPEGTPVVWVQEEPENMGAWRYLRIRFCDRMLETYPFSGIYRPPSASPATGSTSSHRLEEEALLKQAFDHAGCR